MHRDIKLENILLNEVGDIKVGDFGVSKRFRKGELLKERCGTPVYIAPEMFMEIPYDGELSDIWSLGIVLYVMLYGDFPFQGDNIEILMEKIIHDKFAMENTISIKAQSLISKILVKNPVLRPSIKEILEDPWMQNVDESRMFLINR